MPKEAVCASPNIPVLKSPKSLTFFWDRILRDLVLIVSQNASAADVEGTKTEERKHLTMDNIILGLLLRFLIRFHTVHAVETDGKSDGVSVFVETITASDGPAVTKDHKYVSHVTLYIDDGKQTPSGWSTRKEHGAKSDEPFVFQPGHNLIRGWTEGVLQMHEGERAMLHVPSSLGYGSRSMGSPHGGAGGAAGFYIPSDSNLLFDIEIFGKEAQGVNKKRAVSSVKSNTASKSVWYWGSLVVLFMVVGRLFGWICRRTLPLRFCRFVYRRNDKEDLLV